MKRREHVTKTAPERRHAVGGGGAPISYDRRRQRQQNVGATVHSSTQSNQRVWQDGKRPDWKEENLWFWTSLWWAHWQLCVGNRLLSLPVLQQTFLPVVKRQNGPYELAYFPPLATESCGAFNSSTVSLLTILGERLTASPGDLREASYLFWRISYHTAIQFNFNTRKLCFCRWRTGI